MSCILSSWVWVCLPQEEMLRLHIKGRCPAAKWVLRGDLFGSLLLHLGCDKYGVLLVTCDHENRRNFHCDLRNTASMGETMYEHSHAEPRFVVIAIEPVTIRQVS